MYDRIHAATIRKSQKPSRIFTQKALNEFVRSFLNDLDATGFHVHRAVLFGSYVHGQPDASSDVDLAVWAEGFEGNRILDYEKIKHILRNYLKLELHPYSPDDTVETDPFIDVIEKTGVVIAS